MTPTYLPQTIVDAVAVDYSSAWQGGTRIDLISMLSNQSKVQISAVLEVERVPEVPPALRLIRQYTSNAKAGFAITQQAADAPAEEVPLNPPRGSLR